MTNQRAEEEEGRYGTRWGGLLIVIDALEGEEARVSRTNATVHGTYGLRMVLGCSAEE